MAVGDGGRGDVEHAMGEIAQFARLTPRPAGRVAGEGADFVPKRRDIFQNPPRVRDIFAARQADGGDHNAQPL